MIEKVKKINTLKKIPIEIPRKNQTYTISPTETFVRFRSLLQQSLHDIYSYIVPGSDVIWHILSVLYPSKKKTSSPSWGVWGRYTTLYLNFTKMFDTIIQILSKKNIHAIQVKTKEEACQKIQEMIPQKSSVGFGWSRTLEDIQILSKLKNLDYTIFDRTKFPKWSTEARQMMLNSQHADFFLWSCNAITQEWQLLFWETNWNRVSSILYGPNKVILIIWKNKIVKTLEEWFGRLQYVAEQIAKRLETPVEEIMCYKVTIERQWNKDRIFIVFVDENLWT